MLGTLWTLAFAAGVTLVGRRLLDHWVKELDPALAFGVSGLLGLGAIGTITLTFGLIPGSLRAMPIIVMVATIAIAAGAAFALRRQKFEFKLPTDRRMLLVALPVVVVAVFGWIGVLAPSTTQDWDVLAYHLAVPKLWLAAGQIEPISFIHHSNFPFAVDNLYLWGLTIGGESSAKAFGLVFYVLGAVSLFGFAREKAGEWAGWWAAAAFAGVPAVAWESGTAYIDIAHGLYAGLGLLFAARLIAQDFRRSDAVLCGLLFGLALGSKYTGIQIFAAAGVAALLCAWRAGSMKRAVPAFGVVAGFALAIGGAWYVRNIVWTGNPVYPFFYEKFGGKNWDQFAADIYRDEQQTFGVGRTDKGRNPLYIGAAVLGLAYQPGRYVNPGQTQGMGSPFGALGFAVIAAFGVWLLSGRAGKFEGATLLALGLALGMWFFLSQQSRYGIVFAVPLAALAGIGVIRVRAGPAIAAACAMQAGYTLWLMKFAPIGDSSLVDSQLAVVTGKVSREDYLTRGVAFYQPAQYINEHAKGGSVALFDEVFGYLLDVRYFWANPGHSTQIPYASLTDAAEFVKDLKALGMTHVYVNLAYQSPEDRNRWFSAAGLSNREPYSESERGSMSDPRAKFRWLLADAVLQGRLTPEKAWSRSILFRIAAQ